MKNKTGLLAALGGAALVVFSLLVLFGPGPEDKKKNAFLWEKSWAVLEYRPGKDIDGDKTSPGKNAKKPPRLHKKSPHKKSPRKPAVKPRKFTRIPLRFVRKSGLTRDSFYIRSARGGTPGAPPVTRQGAGSVKSLFNDWNRPRLKAVYEGLKPEKLKELGLNQGGDLLLLYSSPDAQPITLSIGKRLKNGNRFVFTNLPEHSRTAFLIPGYIADRLRRPYSAFREKRLIVYPARSYAREIRVSITRKGKTKKIALFQEQKKVKGRLRRIWKSENGRVVNSHIASSLDIACKQLGIQYFADDEAVRKLGEPSALWKLGGDNALVRVKLKGGNTHEIRVLYPKNGLELNKRPLALVRSGREAHTDFIWKQKLDALGRGVDRALLAVIKPRATGRKTRPRGKGKPPAFPLRPQFPRKSPENRR